MAATRDAETSEPHSRAEPEPIGWAPADGAQPEPPPAERRGKTVHGEPANAGHRVLAPDDAEVEAYLETALKAPAPERSRNDRPGGGDTGAGAAAPDTVIVLDFGSQYAQLIARRVRELNVYSELLPHDTPWSEIERRKPKAIILSGGPNSVYDENAPRPDPAVWSGRIPVLGICYGAQLMARELGGDVVAATRSPGCRKASDRPPRPTPRRSPVWSTPRGTCTASSSTPRSSTRRAAVTSCATSSSGSPVRGRNGRPRTSSTRPSRRSAPASTPMRPRRDPTARSSARCRAASTRPWRRPSSIARSAID